jgi:CDP-diacylglycerol--serine O-phosphatidyltransferase
MLRNLPNLITLLNLLAGSASIVALLKGDEVLAFWLLFVAVFADYFDGLVARLLKVYSPLGGQLDSLSDMVSFGLAPGMIVYSMISRHPLVASDAAVNLWALPAFLITLLSAVRLGRFNLDTGQSKEFRGLPTPASTTYFAGLMLIGYYNSFQMGWLVESLPFLYLSTLVFSYLLIAPFPMFHLKTTDFGWRGNELRYSFILIVLLLVILLREAAFSTVIVVYCLLSLIRNKKTKHALPRSYTDR